MPSELPFLPGCERLFPTPGQGSGFSSQDGDGKPSPDRLRRLLAVGTLYQRLSLSRGVGPGVAQHAEYRPSLHFQGHFFFPRVFAGYGPYVPMQFMDVFLAHMDCPVVPDYNPIILPTICFMISEVPA